MPTAALAQVTVMFDAFSHNTGASVGGFTSDLNTDGSGRQMGILPTTYTRGVTAGGQVNLEESATTFAGDDILILRTAKQAAANAASISVQSAVKLDANYAPLLVGKKWAVSYQGRLAQNDAAINDAWMSLSVGDTAATTGPNNALADIGLLIRYNKIFQLWADGAVSDRSLSDGCGDPHAG